MTVTITTTLGTAPMTVYIIESAPSQVAVVSAQMTFGQLMIWVALVLILAVLTEMAVKQWLQ
jgi:hypothetical protein